MQELEPSEKRTFMGYRRKNGKVGVRNEIWIIPTVGCMNNVATSIERQAQKYVKGKRRSYLYVYTSIWMFSNG
ncbi:MAG: UxaA family hydrolase [Holdemanella porci]